MENIIPGGHYSYDSTNKQIWLSYEYYYLGVENIHRIKNLSKNLDFYNSDTPKYPLTFLNGCITHSYPSSGEDEDKIQIVLRTPITDSLTELEAVDGVITLETDGKVLVLPTENADVLPLYNEWTEKPTVLRDNFGGLMGSGSPDYSVGTVYTATDGVYLTDISGTNSTKTLTGGKLKELELLTVDPVGHTITQDFQIVNTGESNNPTVIDACDNTTNWTVNNGTATISVDSGTITAVGTTSDDSNGYLRLKKTYNAMNLSAVDFLKMRIKSTLSGTLMLSLICNTNGYWSTFSGSNFQISANTWTTFTLPVRAPSSGGTNGSVVITAVTGITAGIISSSPSTACQVWLDDYTLDTGKPAYIELATPDNIQNTTLQCWADSSYKTVRIDSLNDTYSNISGTTANLKMLDGTSFDDVYTTGLGRAVFPKGTAEETKNGSTGSITYSANQGTKNRIGYMFSLPPSDGGRTDFNKLRLRVSYPYTVDADDNYTASYDFANSTNASYGLQNITKPWIALYDPTTSLIDFYLFTHRPQNLTYKRNEAGVIHELNLYPGSGSVYHGQVAFTDLTADTDSDTIPDCLEASIAGSVTKFLDNYSMVIPE